jgi:TPR repeat protein
MRGPRLAFGLALIALAACQTRPPLPDYATLAEAADAGEAVAATDLRDAFLASADFAERLDTLEPLEMQATQQMVDEPLRLGGTGSAIIDLYFGSLTGHQALIRFYENLGEADSATAHRAWVERICAAIEQDATGKGDAPFHALSSLEAHAYLRERGLTPAGSMYHSTEEFPFLLIVSARKEKERLEAYYFDLTSYYDVLRAALPEAEREEFSPGSLIGSLAHQDDSAAQASIGAYLVAQERYEDAINWLRAATRTGNVVADVMLARLFQMQARDLEGDARESTLERALDQYLYAVAQGSDEAMFSLGGLYLEGVYGEDNAASGAALLKQAADLGNTDAMLWLGHLHIDGGGVEKSDERAAEYFTRAGALGDARARLAYARFSFTRAKERPWDPRALEWLDAEAEADNAEAMLLLGNFHARGVGVPANARRALGWYRSAVKLEPDDANIVNEVAWTLAVTEIETLRKPGYALDIMNRVMNDNEEARENPAYLDTWAAAHAATGDFERAVATQKDAIAAAETQGDEEVIGVLKQHLEAFESGKVVIDPVP